MATQTVRRQRRLVRSNLASQECAKIRAEEGWFSRAMTGSSRGMGVGGDWGGPLITSGGQLSDGQRVAEPLSPNPSFYQAHTVQMVRQRHFSSATERENPSLSSRSCDDCSLHVTSTRLSAV